MTEVTKNDLKRGGAAAFDRPLLLTVRQDLAGYITRYAGRSFLLLLTCVSVVAVMLIFVFIARESLPFIAKYGVWEFLTSRRWAPTETIPRYGAVTLMAGSLYVTFGAMLLAVPVSLLAAVFLSDIVSFRVRHIIKPVIETLAAIPSVAYGFFAIVVVGPWMQEHLGVSSGANALNASLLLAVMAIPTIVSIAEDSLVSIGRDMREGSYALGATRAETIVKVVIPAAHSGIIAAIILGMMRAVGETMVVLMASGNANQIPTPWYDLTQSVKTMTATVAQEMGEAGAGSDHRRALFAVALALLIFTFIMNMVSEYFIAKNRKASLHTAPGRMGQMLRRCVPKWCHTVNNNARHVTGRVAEGISVAISAMTMRIRRVIDRIFTMLAGLSVLTMLGMVLLILGPIIYNGVTAVFFDGTVEFRKYQLQSFSRGDAETVNAEVLSTRAARDPVFDALGEFRLRLQTAPLIGEAKSIYRQARDQVASRNVSEEQADELVGEYKKARDAMIAAYESADNTQVIENLDTVLRYAGDARFIGTPAEKYLRQAKLFRHLAGRKNASGAYVVDLSKREQYVKQYGKSFDELDALTTKLLGPLEIPKSSDLDRYRYGATRWDIAKEYQQRILWNDRDSLGRAVAPYPRQKDFAGTELEAVFPLIENNLDAMLLPRQSVYWQYFIDDSTAGHFLGGVGPEILGTLALAVLAMLFALPLGVISAAYLIECTRQNVVVSVIRTCVNTLAGVPSIVFGLFGLAFFVVIFLPMLGMKPTGSVWAGALTLAVLVLPVMIRASEEAIRAVPVAYKEAALALGASRIRTFITVTLPSALPGIMTGVILSVGRAAGETAAILFACGAAAAPILTSLSQDTRTLSYGSYSIATMELGAGRHNQYGMVMTLVLLVLVLNTAAIIVRSRLAGRLMA